MLSNHLILCHPFLLLPSIFPSIRVFLMSWLFASGGQSIGASASGEGNGNPLQYSCLENPMDGGAWWAAVHGVAKSRARLSNFTFTFHFHALEKEIATHSRVLAWRIPGTGEPGGLLSMGSHRIGHDWSDLAAAAASLPRHTVPFLNIPTISSSLYQSVQSLSRVRLFVTP